MVNFRKTTEEAKLHIGTNLPKQRPLCSQAIKPLREHVLAKTMFGLYALIGAPLDRTVSHLVHNAIMQKFDLNSSYLKMRVDPESLSAFFSAARTLPFKGLSVTMPLKELVLPYLDIIDAEAQAIGAVNTVVFEKGKATGYNVDGIGAVQALEEKGALQGKRVIILGAGGAAKAIAYVAKKRGALVTVLNRTLQRAEEMVHVFHLEAGGGLEKIAQIYAEGYDVLINCTPMPLPIDPKYIHKGAIVMDIKTRPQPDSLLTYAEQQGSTIIYGYEMWINQALLQYHLWFNDIDTLLKESLRRELLGQIMKAPEGHTERIK